MDTYSLQLLLLLAFGLLQLFFGYPLFRFLVVIAGASIGFTYGPTLLTALTARPVEPWMSLTAALLAAVVLGLLAWLAFWVVVFLWGAALGYGATDAATAGVLLPLLTALVLGVLAVLFQRILIVALTALSGAWLTVTAGAALLGQMPPGGLRIQSPEPWFLIGVLVLAAVGAITQFRRAAPPSRF
ncbi:MAG: hypothetical protein WD273_09125 [Trueperaceae bacterium]